MIEKNIRYPVVSGMFYPENPNELSDMLKSMLALPRTDESISTNSPRAIIVPHAGYVYSGPVAASAYAQIIPAHQQYHRVLLMGPSHKVAFEGIATSHASYFRTPFGDIPLDQATIQQLENLPGVQYLEQAHQYEHSLEVQLPFLQSVLDEFSLIPMVVGNCDPQTVSNVIESVWSDPATLIVISTDLSHYLEYDDARRIDSSTSDAIQHKQPEKIHYENACGRNPLNGLLVFAQQHQLHIDLLDLRNSGDTAGPKDRVVGYGAFAVH